MSPVEGEGLSPGEDLYAFLNTRAGNFGVLICSDYLDESVRAALLSYPLDLLCVCAYQNDSSKYHGRINIDVEQSTDGIYVAYSNVLASPYGDGHSALFGAMDRMYLERLERRGYTDANPRFKLVELDETEATVAVELSLTHRRPSILRNVHTRPNVRVLTTAAGEARETTQFLKYIGHSDSRYANIDELFVPPAEYQQILAKMEENRLLFIVGDPGIGKTYTAAHILRHYFNMGFQPRWFVGLDREDRRIQRTVLEGFQPAERQVVYFEDPFGRTVFENRESLYRFFSPLIDTLADRDSRVIITSRKEIFEQFSREHLSREELVKLTEEMNVIKPSYDSESLKEILNRAAATRCRWYSKRSARKVVHEAIENGDLTTPFGIADFIATTEGISQVAGLRKRLRKRREDVALQFAQEIQGLKPLVKSALAMVLFFGDHTQSTLAGWFSTITTPSVEDSDSPDGFVEHIRSQIGYRVERYGRQGVRLRFSHPYYEEGFVRCAERDEGTMKGVVSIVRCVATDNRRAAFSAICQHRKRYAKVVDKVLPALSDLLHVDMSLGDKSLILKMIYGKSRATEDDVFREFVRAAISPESFVAEINSESELNDVALALNCVYAVRKCLRLDRDARDFLREKLDFEKIISRCRGASKWRSALDVLSLLTILDIDRVRTLVSQMPNSIASNWIIKSSGVERARWKELIQQWNLADLINVDTIPMDSSWKCLRPWILKQGDPKVGVVIDDGCLSALLQSCSLLPVGIVETVGVFERGEFVSIFDQKGARVGAGIAMYNAAEVSLMRGTHSSYMDKLVRPINGRSILSHSSIALLERDAASGSEC